MQYIFGFGMIGAGAYLTQSSFGDGSDGGVIYYGLIVVGAITVIRAWVGA